VVLTGADLGWIEQMQHREVPPHCLLNRAIFAATTTGVVSLGRPLDDRPMERPPDCDAWVSKNLGALPSAAAIP